MPKLLLRSFLTASLLFAAPIQVVAQTSSSLSSIVENLPGYIRSAGAADFKNVNGSMQPYPKLKFPDPAHSQPAEPLLTIYGSQVNCSASAADRAEQNRQLSKNHPGIVYVPESRCP